MTRRPLQIVASCTDRKRLPIPAELRLGAAKNFADWWRRLQQHGSRTVAAADLYAGDHWSVVRDLPAVALKSGFHPHLWVASAGYGLVSADANLRAYGATFAPRHADSVVRSGSDGDAMRAWWGNLTRQIGPDAASPRSLGALARSSPDTKMLVVASPRYIDAMADDLLDAMTSLADPNDLLIVTGEPGPVHEQPRQLWIPSVASLQAGLGGTRISLHARVARSVLRDSPIHGLEASAVRERFVRLAQTAPTPPTYNRTPANDDEVCRFVAAALGADSSATHSRLLRAYRDAGHACEQSRFRRLFQQTKKK